MPEYLAPGVYVEETSFRAKSIEGVGTSTTAFVGPTRKGPFRAGDDTPETPELLTSYGDFERIYGGFADLALGAGTPATNYLAHAVLGFFNEGRIAALRVARGRRGRGTAAAARARRRRRRAGAVRRALPRRGRQRPRHRARSSWRPPRWRRWRRRPPARCCARVRPAALVHHVKVGTEWRPAADLGEPRRRSRRRSRQRTPQILTLLTVATDGERRGREPRRHGVRPHASRAGSATPWPRRPARRSDHLNNLFAIRIGANVSGHRAARRAVRRRGGQRAGRNGAHLGPDRRRRRRRALRRQLPSRAARHCQPRGCLDRRRPRCGGLTPASPRRSTPG